MAIEFNDAPPEIPSNLKEKIGQLKLIAFDFDGVLTDNRVTVHQDGTESVTCSRGDGMGLLTLKKIGIQVCIISSEPNPVVSARAKKLNIECFQGIHDKRGFLEGLLKERDLSPEQAGFVGNDFNDLEALQLVSFPFVVADAHFSVLSFGFYRTKRPGGFGAVREVCDVISGALGKNPSWQEVAAAQ